MEGWKEREERRKVRDTGFGNYVDQQKERWMEW